MMWKDKNPMLFISTHAMPIELSGVLYPITIPCCIGKIQNQIVTSLVHHK